MKFTQKEWAAILLMVGSMTAWLIRMERLTTKLVQQGEYSQLRHEKAEYDIDVLDKRVDNHDTDISILKSKVK